MRPRVLLPLLVACGTVAEPDPCEGFVPTCVAGHSARVCTPESGPTTVDCLTAFDGQLPGRCDLGACVLAWEQGSPRPAATCTDDPRATEASLAAKAATYDERAATLHLHPELGWLMPVILQASEDDPTLPAADPATATWRDVDTWLPGPNDGLWSSLYLASQVFRWQVDVAHRDDVAATLDALVQAETHRMKVTGVPGLFSRTIIPPGIDGLSCPDDEQFRSDIEKDDDRWVRVNDQGCLTALPAEGDTWQVSDVCPGAAYAGWCFKDNVSKDSLVAQVWGLALAATLGPEPAASGARALVDAVGSHLLDNRLRLIDWDGRVTEHGNLHPITGVDAPGFNAAMAMAYLRTAAAVTGRDDLQDYYLNCLIGRDRTDACFASDAFEAEPFADHLPLNFLYPGSDSCLSNVNNVAMHLLSMSMLAWFETDSTVLDAVLTSFDVDMMRHPADRAALTQRNAWYSLTWAALKPHSEGDGVAQDVLDEVGCLMAQVPPDMVAWGSPVPAYQEPWCIDRFGDDSAQTPREPADRCPDAFTWWRDPYSLDPCPADPRQVHPPASFLLPYWMGRYMGLIDAGD